MPCIAAGSGTRHETAPRSCQRPVGPLLGTLVVLDAIGRSQDVPGSQCIEHALGRHRSPVPSALHGYRQRSWLNRTHGASTFNHGPTTRVMAPDPPPPL